MKLRFLFSIFRPFASIARELRIIRELYELDLASRRPDPIYRLTEKASKKDTEVSYSGVIDDRPMYKRWFEQGDEEDEEG